MKARTLTLACSPLLAGMLLLSALPAQGQERGEQKQDNGEVLTRGPVHEAFADPGVTPTEAPPIVPKQPPDPINELPPDQKPEGDNVQWIPGYFSWDEEREDFIWLSGFWRVPPPDRTWIPGSWRQAADGWQWTPGFWQAAGQQQIEFFPPPPPPVEAAPSVPAPNAESIFAPGAWVYRDSRFLWRPGSWIPYRPGWIWIPAHYVWTPAGWVFVDGYYDFPPQNRGLLFAPVYFTNRVWLRPGWVYRPSLAVHDTFLTGALFLRPRWGGYYFGDYFGDVYGRRGFVSWIDFRIGRGVYDPMYSFYRHSHRDERNWDRDMRALYTSRHAGEFLPPRTLAQQNTIVQNFNNNKNVNVTNIKNVTAVAPLARLDPKIVKLQPVSADQMALHRKGITAFRDVGAERTKIETQLLSKGPAPVKPTDAPRSVKLDLPAVTRPVATLKPPPPPAPTNLVENPVITPKDAKVTDAPGGKAGGTGTTTVIPKKDPPPVQKKDAPPPPPMPKKDPPPMQKKDAPPPPPPPPPMQKKDKDKDKKQAAVSVPSAKQPAAAQPLASRQPSPPAPKREVKAAPPVQTAVKTTTPPPKREAKAASTQATARASTPAARQSEKTTPGKNQEKRKAKN